MYLYVLVDAHKRGNNQQRVEQTNQQTSGALKSILKHLNDDNWPALVVIVVVVAVVVTFPTALSVICRWPLFKCYCLRNRFDDVVAVAVAVADVVAG